MDKRYQVFVSSTYADLREERQQVIQTLMEMDCIPAGMELFPAMDEEQLAFIKRIIDDCDYYLVIIGGRYGSVSTDGISFTEKEYEYALSKNLKVVALICSHPEKLSVEQSEMDLVAQQKLQLFRDKVSSGRVVKYWKEAYELPALVALSLQKTIKTYPATGWVRADQMSTTDAISRVNDLQEENNALQQRLNELGHIEKINPDELAQGSDELSLDYSYELENRSASIKTTVSDTFTTTWDEVFSYIAMTLVDAAPDSKILTVTSQFVSSKVLKDVKATHGEDYGFSGFRLDEKSLGQMKLQLRALGLIRKSSEGWVLTEKGDQYVLETGVVRR